MSDTALEMCSQLTPQTFLSLSPLFLQSAAATYPNTTELLFQNDIGIPCFLATLLSQLCDHGTMKP